MLRSKHLIEVPFKTINLLSEPKDVFGSPVSERAMQTAIMEASVTLPLFWRQFTLTATRKAAKLYYESEI